MVTDANFWPAVRNTLLLIVVLIPVQFAFAIAMALLLRAKPRLAERVLLRLGRSRSR